MSEVMRHNYVDIPNTPQPLQEMYWKRQALGTKLGEMAARLCVANQEYNETITEIIQLNEQIREEEER